MNRCWKRLPVLAFLVAAVLPAPTALAETLRCTPISSVPQVIGAPGIYCLTQDVTDMTAVVRNAIEIAADDVVLDLNGHALDGSALGPGAFAFGIYAFGRRNITIRNGTIRGFFYGIDLDDFIPPAASAGHVVEGIRADRNTCVGIVVSGRGAIVRDNHVVETGGSTAFGPDAWGWGLHLTGSGIRVLDNDIVTVRKRGAGVATGIHLRAAADALAVGNRITEADQGLVFDWASSGKFRDNLTSGVATRFTGGSDAGNNN